MRLSRCAFPAMTTPVPNRFVRSDQEPASSGNGTPRRSVAHTFPLCNTDNQSHFLVRIVFLAYR